MFTYILGVQVFSIFVLAVSALFKVTTESWAPSRWWATEEIMANEADRTFIFNVFSFVENTDQEVTISWPDFLWLYIQMAMYKWTCWSELAPGSRVYTAWLTLSTLAVTDWSRGGPLTQAEPIIFLLSWKHRCKIQRQPIAADWIVFSPFQFTFWSLNSERAGIGGGKFGRCRKLQGWDLYNGISVLIGKNTRELALYSFPPWGTQQKTAICKPGKEPSLEPDWASNLISIFQPLEV